MTIEEARGLAAQAWCHDRNSGTVMDTDLAESFAEILVQQTTALTTENERLRETFRQGDH